ncbi:MAG: hypothetical protein U0903_10810 [Planctomycetales bacterium]
MSKLVALDWDERELRFAVVATQRKHLKLLGWGGVPLVEGAAPIPVADAAALAKKIRETLTPYKVGKAKTVLLIDRAKVEQFHFSLPGGIPAAELPGMVLNHLMMESPGVTEESPVDFEAVTSNDPEESRLINAYVATDKETEHFRSVCKQAGLIPESLQFRPHAACVPYQQSIGDVLEMNTLLVTTYHHDAELSLVTGSRIPLSRTIRLPEPMDTDAGAQRLMAEIRRTLLLAPQHLPSGQTIGELRLQSPGAPNEEFRSRIQTETGLPCANYRLDEWLTPAKNVSLETTAQMAPLVGGLLTLSGVGKPLLDFFHPRKPVKKGTNKQTLILVGVMAIVGIVFGLDYLQQQFSKADPELETLRETKSKLEKQIKKLAPDRKLAEAVQLWDKGSVIWLDELRNLSMKMPPGQDLVLSHLMLASGRNGNGSMGFSAVARTPQAIETVETALRDETHHLPTINFNRRADGQYIFDTVVTLLSPPPKSAATKETKPAEKSTSKSQTDEKPSKGKSGAADKPTKPAASDKKAEPTAEKPKEKEPSKPAKPVKMDSASTKKEVQP